jgi:hypothetical protein
MRIGPFREPEVNRVSDILTTHGIIHSVVVDDALANQKIEEVRNQPPDPFPSAKFDPACHMIEMSDEEEKKVGNLLQDFGIVSTVFEPSFDTSEYFCPKCGYSSDSPGQCPDHRLSLVDFRTYASQRSYFTYIKDGKFIILILLPIILIAIYYFLMSLNHLF